LTTPLAERTFRHDINLHHTRGRRNGEPAGVEFIHQILCGSWKILRKILEVVHEGRSVNTLVLHRLFLAFPALYLGLVPVSMRGGC
jgi:hypothetical protein